MKSAPSSSPSTGARRRSDQRQSASQAKRQRLAPPTSASKPASDTNTIKAANTLAGLVPMDTLSLSFLYLDVGDVPSASVTCKDWNVAMKKVEDELWLGLVRKHCSAVEEVTKLLELPAKSDKGTTDSGGVPVTSESDAIPAPSHCWRSQFQRHVLLKRAGAASREPPKPLCSYLFQVDLVLYQKNKGVAGKAIEVGVVSRIFPNPHFDADDRIVLDMIGLGHEMSKYEFSSFDFRVTIHQKATGKQAILVHGGMDDWCCDYNNFRFSDTHITNMYKFPEIWDGDSIDGELVVEKAGCVTSGCSAWGEDFFVKPSCESCCECDDEWSCFWDMNVTLHVANWTDGDITDLTDNQQLRLFEEYVSFK